ncbi:MAG: hypothetical protein ACK4OF_08335 [Aquificaceae bacterium]
MRHEIAALKHQLAEAKKRLRDLDLEGLGLIIAIRTALNPYEEDITKLNIDQVLVLTKRLHEVWTEMKSLREKVRRLEEDLG